MVTVALALKHLAIGFYSAHKTFIHMDQFHIKILHSESIQPENKIQFWKKNLPVVSGFTILYVSHYMSLTDEIHIPHWHVPVTFYLDMTISWAESLDSQQVNIHIWLKMHFAGFEISIKWALQDLAHDMTIFTGVACAKYCNYMMVKNRITARLISHQCPNTV